MFPAVVKEKLSAISPILIYITPKKRENTMNFPIFN